MDVHALFNYPIAYSTSVTAMPPGGLRPTGDAKQATSTTTSSTASAFISPQSLAAFPLASGLVAAFWKGAQLLGDWGKPMSVCFAIAMSIAVLNYVVSITDPKLQTTTREKIIGLAFAGINGVYLFITAIGINVAIH